MNFVVVNILNCKLKSLHISLIVKLFTWKLCTKLKPFSHRIDYVVYTCHILWLKDLKKHRNLKNVLHKLLLLKVFNVPTEKIFSYNSGRRLVAPLNRKNDANCAEHMSFSCVDYSAFSFRPTLRKLNRIDVKFQNLE